MKKHILLLVTLAITNTVISQEKIGNKIYLYGDLEASVFGKTLVYFGINDPKSEIKILEKFKDIGVDAISWNKLFIPKYTYSESERNSTIDKNEISTIIFIKNGGTSYYTQSSFNTTYSSLTNSLNTSGTSGNVLGAMEIEFEIYNREDSFAKPRAVVNASAQNSWGVAGSQSGLTLKIVDRILEAFKDKKAFSQKSQISPDKLDNADSLFNLGVLSYNSKNYVDAEKYYKRVIEIKPDYVNAYLNLAIIKLEADKPLYNEIKNLTDSEKDNKRYEELKNQRTDVFKSALPYLEKAYELNPKNEGCKSTLLSVYKALDMNDKVLKLNEK